MDTEMRTNKGRTKQTNTDAKKEEETSRWTNRRGRLIENWFARLSPHIKKQILGIPFPSVSYFKVK